VLMSCRENKMVSISNVLSKVKRITNYKTVKQFKPYASFSFI
jgi:hypothetical protein